MRTIALTLAIASISALTSACTTAPARRIHTSPDPASAARARPEGGDVANKARWIAKNCPLGLPQPNGALDLGPTELIYREGYVLLHSDRDRVPLFVCEGINHEQLHGPGDRSRSSWRPDPALTGARASDADYRGSGYDRGHMAPAMNAKRTQLLMNETHYLSNAVPQVGPGFNRTVWRLLEEKVRGWMRPTPEPDDTELFIITGPLFWEPEEDDPTTADGVTIETIGPGKVAVPTHLFKLVVELTRGSPSRAVAFVMENREHPGTSNPGAFIRSIRWIEERAGLNFLPELDLDPLTRERVESRDGALFE